MGAAAPAVRLLAVAVAGTSEEVGAARTGASWANGPPLVAVVVAGWCTVREFEPTTPAGCAGTGPATGGAAGVLRPIGTTIGGSRAVPCGGVHAGVVGGTKEIGSGTEVTGAVTVSSGAITGAMSVGTVDVTGAVMVSIGEVTGVVSVGRVDVIGAVTDCAVVVTGVVTDWTVEATGSVTDFTIDVAGSVTDWTVEATGSVTDFTVEVAGSVTDFTVDVAGSVTVLVGVGDTVVVAGSVTDFTVEVAGSVTVLVGAGAAVVVGAGDAVVVGAGAVGAGVGAGTAVVVGAVVETVGAAVVTLELGAARSADATAGPRTTRPASRRVKIARGNRRESQSPCRWRLPNIRYPLPAPRLSSGTTQAVSGKCG